MGCFDLAFIHDLKAQLSSCGIGVLQGVANKNIILCRLLVLLQPACEFLLLYTMMPFSKRDSPE